MNLVLPKNKAIVLRGVCLKGRLYYSAVDYLPLNLSGLNLSGGWFKVAYNPTTRQFDFLDYVPNPDE